MLQMCSKQMGGTLGSWLPLSSATPKGPCQMKARALNCQPMSMHFFQEAKTGRNPENLTRSVARSERRTSGRSACRPPSTRSPRTSRPRTPGSSGRGTARRLQTFFFAGATRRPPCGAKENTKLALVCQKKWEPSWGMGEGAPLILVGIGMFTGTGF